MSVHHFTEFRSGGTVQESLQVTFFWGDELGGVLLDAAPSFLGDNRRPETIPTQYLFTHWPATTKLAIRRAKSAAPLPAGGRVVPAGFRPPALRVKLAGVLVKPPKVRRRISTTSPRADTLAARLAKDQELTLRTLYFEQSRAELPLLVQASLDTLAQALRNYPELRLEVQGHTDNQGDSTLNRQLSQRRAEAVCRYLVSHGVPASCLQPRGLGGTQPIADNRLPAEPPRNRRVVLRPLP